VSPRSAPVPQLLGWREVVKEKSSAQRASATALQRRRRKRANERTNALVRSQRRFQRGYPFRFLYHIVFFFSCLVAFLFFFFPSLSN
jgi:hypothetical protein